MLRRLSLLAFTSILALSFTACMSPYIKRKDGIKAQPEKAVSTLFGGLIVHNQDNQKNGLLDFAIKAGQNSFLKDFGMEAESIVESEINKRGFNLVKDRRKASSLSFINPNKDEVIATLTGMWAHPDGAQVDPTQFRMAFFGPTQIQAAIQKANIKEDYIAFTGLTIRDWNVFGWVYPNVICSVVILDQQGQIVYDSEAFGDGNGSIFIADHGPKNLSLAVERAFVGLDEVKEKLFTEYSIFQ